MTHCRHPGSLQSLHRVFLLVLSFSLLSSTLFPSPLLSSPLRSDVTTSPYTVVSHSMFRCRRGRNPLKGFLPYWRSWGEGLGVARSPREGSVVHSREVTTLDKTSTRQTMIGRPTFYTGSFGVSGYKPPLLVFLPGRTGETRKYRLRHL